MVRYYLTIVFILGCFVSHGQTIGTTLYKNSLLDTRINDTLELEFGYIWNSETPIFKGDLINLINFIRDNLNYPEEAKRDSIEGTIYVHIG